jgi:galactosamine-6-phosphate isomerase
LLAKHHAKNPATFQKLRVMKLDEWGGIPMDDPGTCENQLLSLLIEPLGIAKKRYFGFHSNPADPVAECARMAKRLESEGPIDICVLGLGMNGHVAMNEPAPMLKPFCNVAELAKVTLAHPMLSQTKSPPRYGLGLGMAEILASREILLLVNGAKKREPLKKFLRREISTDFPASFLWLHPNWTLLCDREAAEGL